MVATISPKQLMDLCNRGEAITLALPPLPDLVVSRIDAPTMEHRTNLVMSTPP